MSEHIYQPSQETPISAVSSFNLPVTYDSQLMTPVTMSSYPSVPRTLAPAIKKERPAQVSPTTMSQSPDYHLFADDDGFGGSKFNAPMKYKESSSLHVSTPDNAFPFSTINYPPPFFGPYGVSATPMPTRTSHSPPQAYSMHSPRTLSGDNRRPTQAPLVNYGARNQPPILIAPQPDALRRDGSHYRHHSLQSMSSQSTHCSPHLSQGHSQVSFQSNHSSMATLPSSGRKRKTPESGFDLDIISDENLTKEEQLLMKLSEIEQLSWKDVQEKFNKETGKQMKIPALQMRKKRLLERLRVWTDTEERALTLAWDEFERGRWEKIVEYMRLYGSVESWTKEAAARKWIEMHPEADVYRLAQHGNGHRPSPTASNTGGTLDPQTKLLSFSPGAISDPTTISASSGGNAQMAVHQQQAQTMSEQRGASCRSHSRGLGLRLDEQGRQQQGRPQHDSFQRQQQTRQSSLPPTDLERHNIWAKSQSDSQK